MLADSAAQLDKLRAEKKRAYLKQRQKQLELQANLGEQQRIVDHIDGQLAQAQRYADKLSRLIGGGDGETVVTSTVALEAGPAFVALRARATPG